MHIYDWVNDKLSAINIFAENEWLLWMEFSPDDQYLCLHLQGGGIAFYSMEKQQLIFYEMIDGYFFLIQWSTDPHIVFLTQESNSDLKTIRYNLNLKTGEIKQLAKDFLMEWNARTQLIFSTNSTHRTPISDIVNRVVSPGM